MTYAQMPQEKKCPACHQQTVHELGCPYEGMTIRQARRAYGRHLVEKIVGERPDAESPND